MAFCANGERAVCAKQVRVLSKLIAHLPLSTFRRCVAKHRGRPQGQGLLVPGPVLRHGLCAAGPARVPGDIEVNLRAQANPAVPWAFVVRPFRATRWPTQTPHGHGRFYADFAQHLIAMARPLYAQSLGIDLDATVYAFDATTIDLCLSLHPWAPFRSHQGCREAAHPVGPAWLHPQLHSTSPMAKPTRSMCWTIC